MRTFSIRLDDELFQKLESVRGENSRADYIREVLLSHFKEPDANLVEPDANLTKEIESLKAELTHEEKIVKIMEERVKDLQNSLGYLQLEFSRLNSKILLPESTKRWWKFWKK
jgi:predicted DNA-binding protein